jgi:hypothetical protein
MRMLVMKSHAAPKRPKAPRAVTEADLTHPPKIQKLVKTGFDRDDVAPGHWWGDGAEPQRKTAKPVKHGR